MPVKLILFLIIIVVVTVFAGFNISNVCNVSLIFYEFQNVPVFVTVLFSFVIGILVMLPFTFRKKTPKQNNSVAVGHQQNPVLFHIKGEDVVITKQNGEFVTIMKGGIANGRVKNARKREI